MFKYLVSAVFLVTLTSGFVALSDELNHEIHESPYRRTCRINSGEPWDVNVFSDSGPADQIELCRFGGAGVSVETYYDVKVNGTQPAAVSAFLNSSGQDCNNAGGSTVDGTDLVGASTPLCSFSDGSMIESGVLAAGPNSPLGAPLAHALSN